MLCVTIYSNTNTSLIPDNYTTTSASGLDLPKNRSPSIRNRNSMIPMPWPFCHHPLALHHGTEFAARRSTLSLFRELRNEQLYYWARSTRTQKVLKTNMFFLHFSLPTTLKRRFQVPKTQVF